MDLANWILFAFAALIAARWIWMRRGIVNIPPAEVQRRLDQKEKIVVVDVREAGEYRSGHIPGALLVSLSSLATGAAKLQREAETVLVCASGNRSVTAYHRLKALGFTNLRNMPGGMSAWRGPVTNK